MTPGDFLKDVLAPGLLWMEQTVGFVPPASREARLLLLAIAGQESNWDNVQQIGGGPGRGYFQMEPPTCGLILRNPTSHKMAIQVCAAVGIPPTVVVVYGALILNPIHIAVPFARLDVYCDPRPLPAYGGGDAAWRYYLDNWRPGKPSASRWKTVYPQALAADKAWSAGAMHQGPTP